MQRVLESICLFLPSGNTFTFKNLVVLIDNEQVLVFRYVAMSDENRKTMTVYKKQIIGYSEMEDSV